MGLTLEQELEKLQNDPSTIARKTQKARVQKNMNQVHEANEAAAKAAGVSLAEWHKMISKQTSSQTTTVVDPAEISPVQWARMHGEQLAKRRPWHHFNQTLD